VRLEAVEDEAAAAPERERYRILVDESDVEIFCAENEAPAREEIRDGGAEHGDGRAGSTRDESLTEVLGVAQPDRGGEDAGDLFDLGDDLAFDGARGLEADGRGIAHATRTRASGS